jgi:hypothetical protein
LSEKKEDSLVLLRFGEYILQEWINVYTLVYVDICVHVFVN